MRDDYNKTNNNDLQENVHELDDENIDINETNETNYVGVFLPIGTGLGVSFGIIFDNLSIGISLGAAFGLLIGTVVGAIKKKK